MKLRSPMLALLAVLLVSVPVSARDIHRSGTGSIRNAGVGYNLDAGVRQAEVQPSTDIVRDEACVEPSSSRPAGGCHTLILSVFQQSGITNRLAGRPSFRTCRDKRYRGGAQDTDGDGAWYCVRTSAGRYGRLQVTHWPVPGEPVLRFSYHVWV